jgi:TonB family protein
LLVFSYVGYKTQMVKALFAEEMTVKLLKDPDYREPVEVRSDQPYVVVEQMPQYPGGEKELLKFIAQNTQYPVAAKAGNIEGKVIIRFVINTEGNTEDISVLKGVHPVLDAEAARVIGMLKGFVPGYQNGKAVDVYYKVPITFALRSRFPDVKQQPLASSVEEPVADGIISTKDIIVVGFKDSPSAAGPLSIVNASDRSPANPLIVVDGRQGDRKLLETIDPGNIESISVLKDGSATAVYGEKAKNGVIIVKLKKGVSLREP